jgi:hypothetical protein
MNIFRSLNPITRRALRIDYRSPSICEEFPVVSGTGTGAVDTIDILPTLRLAGPELVVDTPDPGSANLAWTNVPTAYAYVVYRASAAEGPFTTIVSGILDRFFVDTPAVAGTYYYKVTAIEPDFGETEASNVVAATV